MENFIQWYYNNKNTKSKENPAGGEHFFEIFGKFVNRNAIKSDCWGVVGRCISKISKKRLNSAADALTRNPKTKKICGHVSSISIQDNLR